jgi:hypothetical protein
MASERQQVGGRGSGRKALDYIYLGFFAFHLVVMFGACTLLCPYFLSRLGVPPMAGQKLNQEQNT